MGSGERERVRLPPRWFIRLAWYTHRGLYRITRGRFGLRRARPGTWGMMRLTTIGRRTGTDRGVILAYMEYGENVVTIAMNGWADPEPAWWLNLQTNPLATLTLPDRRVPVCGREATGEERLRLWAKWQETNPNLDAEAALRSRRTAVVVLEPIQTFDDDKIPHASEVESEDGVASGSHRGDNR